MVQKGFCLYMCGHKYAQCMIVCREACVCVWIRLHNTNYNPMPLFRNINVNQPFNLYTRTPGGGGREGDMESGEPSTSPPDNDVFPCHYHAAHHKGVVPLEYRSAPHASQWTLV